MGFQFCDSCTTRDYCTKWKTCHNPLRFQYFNAELGHMRTFSETAWEIASRYSAALASETRDLAAAIDTALIKANRKEHGLELALEPVAWRWRIPGINSWVYTETKPEGPSVHLIEVEPLYLGAGK